MANPFLMMDDEMDDGSDGAVNPFLLEGTQNDGDLDNPFIPQANNPFAAFGDDTEDASETTPQTTVTDLFHTEEAGNDAAMSFFGTTIQEEDALSVDLKNQHTIQHDESSGISVNEDELVKKKAPPARPIPPSQQTQELIYAISDQLDQASSQMLDRIPVTRTPSPVSMRDLHSPSPTPDSAMADLLDVSDENLIDADQNNSFNSDLIGNPIDNPFAPTSIPNVQAPPPIQHGKDHPSRPPPPRPAAPPRPVPPSIPTGPLQVSSTSNYTEQQHNTEGDLFDMFGTTAPPKPPPPKTKEDILSLFTAPVKPQGQPDLLSDDIVLINTVETEQNATTQNQEETTTLVSSEDNSNIGNQQEEQVEPVFTTTITEPDQNSKVEENVDYDTTEKSTVMHSINPTLPKRAPTPDIEITTVPDLPRSDDEEEESVPQSQPEPEPEKEIEAVQESELMENVITDNNHPIDLSDTVNTISNSIDEKHEIYETEQMDTGLDFGPPSGAGSANPFASPEDELPQNQPLNIFGNEASIEMENTFVKPVIQSKPSNFTNGMPPPVAPRPVVTNIFADPDEFDAFSAKFESVKKDNVPDAFGGLTPTTTGDAWGDSGDAFGSEPSGAGFGGDEGFDSFLAMKAPQSSYKRRDSADSDDKEFSVVIRPKENDLSQGIAPVLAPPPPPRGSQNNSIYSGDSSPRVNPFDKSDEIINSENVPTIPESSFVQRTDSQETPPTPLFDEDVSQPLEDFPRITYTGPGWDMQLRQPNKKKITGQRFWKKVYVRLVYQNDIPAVQLFNQATDKTPFQELPLQPSYSVSDIAAQQFDQFGKIFTLKLQYIFYKERPGVRPGQVTKAERITNKLSQFAAYAIQGDYQGVKEFGSDLKKLGLPVEHAPQVSQLFKVGSMSFEDLKQFSVCIEEALFKISAHRDRALNYKMEEVQLTAVDEIYVEQDAEGHVHKQIARVRLFFLGFLSGMPSIELGLNDLWRQGKEVVGRHDIIPVVTEEWIRLEGVEFHNVVHQDEYERSRTIKFQPPDACYIELMRFRVRPPKNRELPFQLKASWCVTGNRVELKADILVPGFASRKLGQIPCEDVSIRFPIPECWIYLFRVEKHFRYGSVKSAHRRTGKIKGIERILGAVETLQESLIEVTSGQAKYEHHHRAIVWRCPRLPKEGQGAYTTHQMVCRMALTSYDQIPDQLAPYAFVEFTMPATQVSHTTVRSVSVQESDSDDPPEKYVRYLARHEYRVGIETTQGESPNAYLAATRSTIKEEAPPPVQPASSPMAPSDSDSDSN